VRRISCQIRPAVSNQVDRQHPVDDTHAVLEHAFPVHPVTERVGVDPGAQELSNLVSVFLVTRHLVCSSKNHELVMPVGFPDEFAVAVGGKVAVVGKLRKAQRRVDAGRVIAVPIERYSVVNVDKVEIAQAISKDGLRLGEYYFLPVRPDICWQGLPGLAINRAGAKTRREFINPSRRIVCWSRQRADRNSDDIEGIPKSTAHAPE